jgi:hypothetical protein
VTRTPEQKAARSAHVRITVWRAVHDAHVTGEHVVVRWWNRIYNGHITEIDGEGFRVFNHGGDGAWCSWEGTTAIEKPWWDVEATLVRDYPEPCVGCKAYFDRKDAGDG